VLTNSLEDASVGFSATLSDPDFEFHDNILRVCARKVDKIKVCGWPYVESLGRRMKMTEHETFNHWFNLAKTVFNDANVEPMFASTLVMDGKVAVAERQDTGANSPRVPSLFEHWAAEKHDKQRENNFWNYHHKKHQNYPPVAAAVSTGHRVSPHVDWHL
jgi:hypothetical protein